VIWRKGARSPKLSALLDILAGHAAVINAASRTDATRVKATPRKVAASAVRPMLKSRKAR
jgi:hypothetical protein